MVIGSLSTLVSFGGVLCVALSIAIKSYLARNVLRIVGAYLIISAVVAIALATDCQWSDYRHHSCATIPDAFLPFARVWLVVSWIGVPFIAPACLLFGAFWEIMFRQRHA